MLIVCWSVKGGSGTTVVAASLAVLLAERCGDARLIDLAGDSAAALGVAEPTGPGVSEWLAADPPPGPDGFGALAHAAGAGLDLVARGGPSRAGSLPPSADLAAWSRLAEQLTDEHRPTVVDAGCAPPPEPLTAAASASLLVIRPCYLALRRAAAAPAGAASGVVVVHETGRALSRRDVESTLQLPVVAEIPSDPVIARAVDAGLLLGRLPVTIARPLRSVV